MVSDSYHEWMEHWYLRLLEMMGGSPRWRRGMRDLGCDPEDFVGDFLLKKGEKLFERDYEDPQIFKALTFYFIECIRRIRDWDGGDLDWIPGSRRAGPAPHADTAFLRFDEGVRILAALDSGRSTHDLGAVLLLTERVAMLRGAAMFVNMGHVAPPPSAVVEHTYPWGADEGARRVSSDGPSISEIWAACAAEVDRTLEPGPDDAELARVLGFSKDNLWQMKRRARTRLEAEHDYDSIRSRIPTWRRRLGGGGR